MAKNPKATNADTQEMKAETLEQTNADTQDLPGDMLGMVYVFANLPSGQSFALPNGEVVTIEGMTIDNLRGAATFAGGKYAVTPVSANNWKQIQKIYGEMRMFKSGLVFAADTIVNGEAMARERGGLRHGLEPVDPNRPNTQPHEKE